MFTRVVSVFSYSIIILLSLLFLFFPPSVKNGSIGKSVLFSSASPPNPGDLYCVPCALLLCRVAKIRFYSIIAVVYYYFRTVFTKRPEIVFISRRRYTFHFRIRIDYQQLVSNILSIPLRYALI